MSDSEEDLCFEAGEPVPTDADEEAEEKARDERRVPSALTAAKLQKAVDTAHKRGLVYLSRVAPFMKPQKLRFLLSKYGEVLRIYLAAEGAPRRQRAHARASLATQTPRRAASARRLAETAARSSQRGAQPPRKRAVRRAHPALADGWSLRTRRLPSAWPPCSTGSRLARAHSLSA